MKRSIALLLPLLFVLASCGTTAQYSQQRFQDGMYTRPYKEAALAKVVQPYPEEYFAQQAAAQVAQKQDSLQLFQNNGGTTVYNTTYDYNPLWNISIWPYGYNRWYWSNWYWNDPFWYGGWYGPGFYDPFYSPWYSPWYDPWYGPYDPWYGPVSPWIRPINPVYPGMRNNYYYGPRNTTQESRSRNFHPGSSGSNRRPSTTTYGSAGSSVITRSGSNSRPSTGNFNTNTGSSTGTRTGAANNQRVIRSVGSSSTSNTRSAGSYNNSSRSTSTTSYTNSRSSSSSVSRGSSSSSSSSGRSGGSYGGGGGYSGGGGSSSHSGGGGASHGGHR